MIQSLPTLDAREPRQLVAELLARRLGYVPQWSPDEHGPDAALVEVVARYWQAIIQRLNQAPQKNKLAFFDTLGISLIPAQAARTIVVFRLADNVNDARIPANTRIAAPPPPERTDQIIFETERATGLAAAKLKQVVSLWPGRDQYIDHSAAFRAGEAFEPFKKRLLQDTQHHLYIAHDTLLALAGASSIDVSFELVKPSSEHLDIVWEYFGDNRWLPFKDMQPQCDNEAISKFDTTDGLRFSGRFALETDCGEATKTNINGIEAFWIRGRLNEPLPLDPAQVLPEVENLKLDSSIARPLTIALAGAANALDLEVDMAQVIDESGAPVAGVRANRKLTDFDGQAELKDHAKVEIQAGQFTGAVNFSDGRTIGRTVQLSVDGLKPDKAFSDTGAVDLTKPFFPLGLQPQPGTAFYFTNEEVFSKPGARLDVFVQTTISPQDQLEDKTPTTGGESVTSNRLSHTVRWEYWNGRDWRELDHYTYKDPTNTSPMDFSGAGLITGSLRVPVDMEKTKVNGEEALWMRVRLLSGGYGFKNSILGLRSTRPFNFIVTQPPALAKFLLGYTWQYGPFNAEHVLTFNDFAYEDRTDEARLSGETFRPFAPISDRTPALYMGFDKSLPVDRLGILFNIEEQPDDTNGPALLWQYWNGASWEDLLVDDETRNLRLPGLVSLIGPDDSQPLARFGVALHWLRARLKEDGPPGEPTIMGLFPNSVHAVQHQTIVDEPIGASNGQANQIFSFRQIPVLDGERIEVREVAGLRANVEWRLVAREVLASDSEIDEVDTLLALEGTQTEVTKGDLRLIRDRNKRVTEVWVHWQSRRHLLFSGPNDRDYVVDRARGLLLFGDAANGKVPPPGAGILARQYRTGGGRVGNIAPGKISQVLGPVGGIEGVFNPLPAEGGADGESLTQYEIRAPQTLRHRGRALLPEDYETLAHEASPAVAFARAIPTRDPGGRRAPGWVTLLIIQQSADPRPLPSFELREQVRQHIEERTSCDLAAAHKIYVTGPAYLPIDVDAVVVPLDPSEAGSVEQSALDALQIFFHPLTGGPDGKGWDLGRDVFVSDVAAVLERVVGVDYVKELTLLLNSERQGETVKVANERVVAAGQFRIAIGEA